MKKLELEILWNGESLEIVNEPFVLEQCRKTFQPGFLDCTVTAPFQWKSTNQRNRFFAAVADAIHLLLIEAGYDFPNKLSAVYYIMENLPSEGLFGLSDKWVEVVRDGNGNVVSRKARAISGMSRAELNELDQDLVKFLAEHGVDVPSSDEYKNLGKLKRNNQ